MADRLLDTNAISAAMKGDATFVRFLRDLGEDELLFSSSIVEGEIRFGLSRLPEGRRKRTLISAFSNIRASLQEVLPVTQATALRYAAVKKDLWTRGQPIGENDLWIASTAVERGLILVTNDSQFQAIEGLEIENWVSR